jgi:2-polyprenyl-3-methyl-5-hydroxy-6-metoxy-1,4-benzoquinol methylase
VTNIYNESGLQCLSCAGSDWQIVPNVIVCLCCKATYAIEDGVVRMHTSNDGDEITQFYSSFHGTSFINVSFENNPLIYITTRAYRQFLDRLFQKPSGSLIDFGCGDGRFSLWAAEKGFSPVVAVDSNLASLKRLAVEVLKRDLKQVAIVCANLKKPPFQPDHFDAVLCIEVLYYLVQSLGRRGSIKVSADLLRRSGKMVISEFSRLGRAIIDLDAMNFINVRSLIDSSTRWEKVGDSQTEVFQWNVAELKNDLREAELHILEQSGISIAAAIFNYAWNFTSYPLRPRLDVDLRTILETISDQTSDAVDSARNIVFAVEKFNR